MLWGAVGFRSELAKSIKHSVRELYKLDLDPSLEHPREEEFGDYATGIALRIASRERLDPLKIARQLAQKLSTINNQQSTIKKIDVTKPGFINFWLKDGVLIGEVSNIIEAGDDYGRSAMGKGKTVIVDYSSPNIAKPFGVGHLRSTIIGQALCNLYAFAGWKVVGENYLGDWGTQFGKLICAVLKWGDEGRLDAAERPIKELEKLYVKFHREVEKDPSLEEEARKWFKRLEDGDREAARLWKKFRQWSLEEFGRVYRLLGVRIDEVTAESYYSSHVDEVLKEARERGVAIESEGALVIPLDEAGMPPLMLLKSDGATTYESRDLAAIKVRGKKHHPDIFLYETGVEQQLRFKQLFAAAVKLGYGETGQFAHVGHGLYRLPGGKLSTRRGKTIYLEEVLEEAICRARKVVEDKNPRLLSREKDRVSRAVGIGAVKYSDLSQHPASTIVFDWERMLSLEGNSAPYLQYTYARAKSVLKKSGEKQLRITDDELRIMEEESQILRYIYRFPEVVEEAAKSYTPNIVCGFLFELAQRFNTFYARVPIIKAEDSALRALRLGLTAAVAQTIKNGLTLLGIEVPERL